MRPLTLVVIQGPDRGRAYELRSPATTIGRGADNAIVISDPTVSRRHVEVVLGTRSSGAARVHNRAGKNPAFVNGKPVAEASLRPGDKLAIGSTIFLVAAPAGEAPPPARIERPGSTLTFPVAAVGGARLVGVVGRSAAFAEAQALIARLAPTDVSVLITGESGTGKELAARALHYNSPRARRPFVVVDAAALPPGLVEVELFGCERGAYTGADRARPGRFEEAQGGTIFLDEIGELPLESQPKLLRALEEHTVRRVGGAGEIAVDVRVIAATNRDLSRAVAEGRFRADLYYRLAVATVRLPALRDRIDDLEDLVRYYCDRFAPECGRAIETIAPATLELLRRYPWPGNIRELRNVVRAALALGTGEVLRPEDFHLPEATTPPEPARTLKLRDEAEERARLAEALRAAGGNKTRAAEILGIGRTTLYEKLHRHGLEEPARRANERP